jgi:hypothetical protein
LQFKLVVSVKLLISWLFRVARGSYWNLRSSDYDVLPCSWQYVVHVTGHAALSAAMKTSVQCNLPCSDVQRNAQLATGCLQIRSLTDEIIKSGDSLCQNPQIFRQRIKIMIIIIWVDQRNTLPPSLKFYCEDGREMFFRRTSNLTIIKKSYIYTEPTASVV